MSTILITGASGFIGENLIHRFASSSRIYAVSQSQKPVGQTEDNFTVDLADRGAFTKTLGDLQIDTVLHTAAMSKPDECERTPDRAYAVNVEGTKEIAQWAKNRKARLIYFSTDLVFDGQKGFYREEDKAEPVNLYSRTKLEGEKWVQQISPDSVIVRLALSYGPTWGTRGDWTDGMRKKLESGQTLHLFTDQYRTPAYAEDTAEAVFLLLQTEAKGIYHIGGGERLSRYDFGKKFAHIFGLPKKRLVPILMAEAGIKMPLSIDCSLNTDKISRELGLKPVKVEEGLRRQLMVGSPFPPDSY